MASTCLKYYFSIPPVDVKYNALDIRVNDSQKVNKHSIIVSNVAVSNLLSVSFMKLIFINRSLLDIVALIDGFAINKTELLFCFKFSFFSLYFVVSTSLVA